MKKWNMPSLAAILFTLFITHCSLLIVNAQSQFQLAIGGSGFEYAASIIQNSSGGYTFVGTSGSFGPGSIYIVAVDASGSIQWTKTVGGGTEWGRSIIQTSDGGYAVCGSTHSFSAGDDDMYIIKLMQAVICYGLKLSAEQFMMLPFPSYRPQTAAMLWLALPPLSGLGAMICIL